MTDMEMLLVEERRQTNPTHLDSSAAAKSPPPRALITATTFDAPTTRGGGALLRPCRAAQRGGGEGAGARECGGRCNYLTAGCNLFNGRVSYIGRSLYLAAEDVMNVPSSMKILMLFPVHILKAANALVEETLRLHLRW